MMYMLTSVYILVLLIIYETSSSTIIEPVASSFDDFEVLEMLKTNYNRNLRNRSSVGQVTPLQCQKTFQKSCAMYPYVRFWNDKLSQKDCVESPARHPLRANAPLDERKYLVFEPDRGGWNNIRMAAETAMIFALATGRVLVLPPKAKWYLLDKNNGGKSEDNISSFSTFFDLKKIAELVDMISMEEFLETVSKAGLLKEPYPKNAGPVKAFSNDDNRNFWDYVERACYCQPWAPHKKFIALNISKGIDGNPIFGEIDMSLERVKQFSFTGERVPIVYNRTLHEERAIFFPGNYRDDYRMLTHYYGYLYFAQPKVDHAYKRLMRDRLHYRDEIFCAAGRAVRRLLLDASRVTGLPAQDHKYYNPKSLGGKMNGPDQGQFATFFAFHIRRGDFQYEDTRVSAEKIWENTKDLLNRTVTSLIYISTDETNRSFFKPFMQDYTVKFLDDYMSEVLGGKKDLNRNYIGMIEQVICANAHTFIGILHCGTPYSTFTGYITRMRGYYRDDRYNRTYYTMQWATHQLHQQPDLSLPIWAREFSTAHKNVDDDSPANTRLYRGLL